MAARRVAIILLNLGGPDSIAAVRPFLFNLFNDPAIISLPGIVRTPLAALISALRAPKAAPGYERMGGASPLLKETEAQGVALQRALQELNLEVETRVFTAMRYWRPFSRHAAQAARAWNADEALLLPLYPQFSSTTTASSIKAWRKAWRGRTRSLCCYPAEDKFAQAHAEAILEAWRAGGSPARPRVLFSAHGLPERVIAAGDPYQWQVERTVEAVRAKLPSDWDARACYQSRVGPLKWIGPSTEAELEAAAQDGVGVIVSPIAFVSEHVETLIELDVEYAERAHQLELPFYLRAPALGVRESFIQSLAEIVARALAAPDTIRSAMGERICPRSFGLCPNVAAGAPV